MLTDPRVDEYLAGVAADERRLLERVRGVIRRAAPDAEETISYGMPAFKGPGRFFISYAAWQRHCSIYPLSDAFLAAHVHELEGFNRTKGSLHFTPERPLPDDLLEALVLAEVARSRDTE